MAGWAKKGFQDAPEEMATTAYVSRFRLPQPKGKVKPSLKKARPLIITTKGEPCGVYEYEIWVNDRKYHYTSLSDHEISSYDPLAELARLYKSGKLTYSGKYPPVRRAYYALMFTALDLGTWTDRNGEEHDCTKCLVAVKQSQIGEFELRMEKHAVGSRGLYGTEWRVMRLGGDKSPQIGDWWDYQRTLSEDELFEQFEDYLKDKPELLEPYDVESLLEPKSVAELEKVAISLAGRKVINLIRPDWYVPEEEEEEKPKTRRKKKSTKVVEEEDEEEEERPRKRTKKKKRRPRSGDDEDRPRKRTKKKKKRKKPGSRIPL